jgi:raffinose synthase
MERDPYGVFVTAELSEATSRARIRLGMPEGVRRFMACHRYDPYWMTPATGDRVADVPVDTQYLLLELHDGSHLLVVPLVDEPFHVSLEGKPDGLHAVLDTGDPGAKAARSLVAYVAVDSDPYRLIRRAATQVCARLGIGRLRMEKEVPDFVDQFGWCTWDAFYRSVCRNDVRRGLESFRQGGVEPRFMILDDGWQSTTDDTNEGRLTSFSANGKFEGGLRATVELAKQSFRVKTFLVWHTVHGYWGGTDPEALTEYQPERILRWYSPEVLTHAPGMNREYCGAYGSPPRQSKLASFYQDYHRALSAEGVDGVKVDNQGSVEGLAVERGGRVREIAATRAGLEASTRRNFSGRLINCMSCSSETFYLAQDSMLTRTSTDFWPERPASHGRHLYVNAMVSLWFGEFVQPDWDMFQSGHPAGLFHAAGRAISGGPIYVSDKPDGHDFELLERLVLSDGNIARCRDVARPTRDCLYTDPTQAALLLKLFNENEGSFVVGAFNARDAAGQENRIRGQVGPSDIPGLVEAGAGSFALYQVMADELVCVDAAGQVELELSTLAAEIVAIVPVRQGLAAVGLMGKLNPGGTIRRTSWEGRTHCVEVRDGGKLLCYADCPPRGVRVDGGAVPSYDYDARTGRLTVAIGKGGEHRVEIDAGHGQ